MFNISQITLNYMNFFWLLELSLSAAGSGSAFGMRIHADPKHWFNRQHTCCRFKGKTEAQAIFLITFTGCSSRKGKLVCLRRNKWKLSICKRTKRTCPPISIRRVHIEPLLIYSSSYIFAFDHEQICNTAYRTLPASFWTGTDFSAISGLTYKQNCSISSKFRQQRSHQQ